MTRAALRQAGLRRAIARWYRRHARDLPWRRTRDPYAILVSEIMLQQTQVDRVTPRYSQFLRRFPTIRSLADAPLRDVLCEWSGLGYNSRARRLWECAQTVVREHNGLLPCDPGVLMSLPGIGAYTAAAVASFAFGAHVAPIDVNVRRVLSRALDGVDVVSSERARALADLMLPRRRAYTADWNQALMDVGAKFCRPLPKCDACPARLACRAWAKGCAGRVPMRRPQPRYEGSNRFYRGRIVKLLARVPSLSFLAIGKQVKEGFEESDLPWLENLLTGLVRDGLVTLDQKRERARLP